MNDAEKTSFLAGVNIKLVLAFLAAGAMGGLPAMAFSPLTPFLAAEFTLTEFQIGLITTAMGMGSLLFSLPAGKLVDQRGSATVLFVGSIAAVGAVAGVSFSTGLFFLLIVYFFSGAIRPFTSIASTKATMISVPPEKEATFVGLVHVGPSLASALTSAVLPTLALMLGWRLGMGIFSLTLLPFCFWLYHALTGKSASAENTEAPPGNLLSALEDSGFRFSLVIWACYMAGLFVFLTFFVLYLTQQLNLSPTAAGGYLALVQIAAVAGRPLWGVASDRFFAGSRYRTALFMGVASTAVFAALAFLPAEAPPLAVGAVALAAGGSIMSSRPVGTTLAMQLVSDEYTTRALAVLSLVTWIVSMILPPLFGVVITATGSWRLAWILLSLVVGGSALLLILRPNT